MNLNLQTHRFSPSDRVTNATASQGHPNSILETGQYCSLIAENQRSHQNIPRQEKMYRNNLVETRYVKKVKKNIENQI